jgi:hypothetical protein
MVAYDRLSKLMGDVLRAEHSDDLVRRVNILLDTRDVVRAQVLAASDVYNSDFDKLASVLEQIGSRRPTKKSLAKIKALLLSASGKWPAKLEQFDRIRK